ncbi:hypothetical protein [Agrobacterium sp. CG674]
MPKNVSVGDPDERLSADSGPNRVSINRLSVKHRDHRSGRGAGDAVLDQVLGLHVFVTDLSKPSPVEA